jgi:hypothetical protein
MVLHSQSLTKGSDAKEESPKRRQPDMSSFDKRDIGNERFDLW